MNQAVFLVYRLLSGNFKTGWISVPAFFLFTCTRAAVFKRKTEPMRKKVTTISVKLKDTPIRVAAYCRVSTGDVTQQSSLQNQEQHYRHVISSHKGWIYAGVYSDPGISGTYMASLHYGFLCQDRWRNDLRKIQLLAFRQCGIICL